MKSSENSQVGSEVKKVQIQSWGFLLLMVTAIFFVAREGATLNADSRSRSLVAEDLNSDERRDMVSQLLLEGDQYLGEKNYNLANASYESVFLLEPNHPEASKRIDGLKKHMLGEGRSETELVTRVYDEEIEERALGYLNQAKQLIAQQKWGQARFTLQKLLLIQPLHKEGRKLYESVNQKTAAGT